jgi:O-antigen ligase
MAFAPSRLLYYLTPAVAALLFFQLHVPFGATALNVNLADPLAPIAAAAFVYVAARQRIEWRVPGVLWAVIACTGVMTTSLLIGYANHGWIQWARVNKYAGWFVLLAFGASGALAGHLAPERALAWFVYTFCAIGVVAIGQQCLVNLDLIVPRPMNGFAQNANAFAFQALMALCVLFAAGTRRELALAIIPAACIAFSGSRTAFGALIVVLIVSCVYIRGKSLKMLGIVAGAGSVIVIVFLLSKLAALTGDGTSNLYAYQLGLPFSASYAVSNAEHYQTLAQGLGMFAERPLFGHGLGSFVALWQGPATAHVIHSTPVWFLAEFGIAGTLVFTTVVVLLFCNEMRRFRSNDVRGNLLVLLITAFAAMSLLHEMMYQRALWFLLGLCLTVTPAVAAARARQASSPSR